MTFVRRRVRTCNLKNKTVEYSLCYLLFAEPDLIIISRIIYLLNKMSPLAASSQKGEKERVKFEVKDVLIADVFKLVLSLLKSSPKALFLKREALL